MTGVSENGEQPILNVEGDLVALGPLRRDLLPLYARWINDLGAARTLGAFLPVPAAARSAAKAAALAATKPVSTSR